MVNLTCCFLCGDWGILADLLERQRLRKRKSTPLLGHFSKAHSVKAGATSWVQFKYPFHCGEGSNYLGHLLLPPRVHIRKLESEVQIIQHGGMNLNYYSKCVLQETWIFTWGYSLECLMKPCINVTDAYNHELLGFVPTIVIQQESRPLPCSENAAEWLSLSYTLYLVPWKIHLFLWISMVLY